MFLFFLVVNGFISFSAYCYSVASSLLPTQVNESKKLVESIFNAGGLCVQVSEDMMNAVGALSGSGVAYVSHI